MSKTQPARGMRDFLPADVRKREYVIGIIKEVYESYGFEPLETPAVENLETLMGKYGEEGNQLVFKILKRGEKFQEELAKGAKSESEFSDLALRYDLTVPLARVVANNRNELPKFFKRYQIQPVWRADRPAKGRFREFYQCDVDAIGSSSMTVEAELCCAVSEILQRLGFKDFVIRINHRKTLSSLLVAAGISENKQVESLVVLDKLDKIGRAGVEKEFKERGIVDEAAARLLAFFEFFIKDRSKTIFEEKQRFELLKLPKAIKNFEEGWRKSEKVVQALEAEIPVGDGELEETRKWLVQLVEEVDRINIPNGVSPEILRESPYWKLTQKMTVADLFILLKITDFTGVEDEINGVDEMFQLLGQLRLLLPQSNVKFDPTLARGLSYYTGAIFEINVPDLAGSLGGGGRYDGLIGMFGKEQIPACGFSLGLERILVVMEERNMFEKPIAEGKLKLDAADIMITIGSEEAVADSLALAQELRAKGLRVLLYPEADKMAKQFKYAGQIKVPFVALLNEDDKTNGTVTIANMTKEGRETVRRSEVRAFIKK